MRDYKQTIIALSGASAAGKTYLAKKLSEELSLSVRYCGEAIKLYAKEKGVHISKLTQADHEKLDQATLKWISANGKDGCVVEGRFLHFFLKNMTNYHIINIEVTASDHARQLRFEKKGLTGKLTIEESDNRDRLFAKAQYGSTKSVDLKIDNSSSYLSIKDILKKIGTLKEKAK